MIRGERGDQRFTRDRNRIQLVIAEGGRIARGEIEAGAVQRSLAQAAHLLFGAELVEDESYLGKPSSVDPKQRGQNIEGGGGDESEPQLAGQSVGDAASLDHALLQVPKKSANALSEHLARSREP